MTNALEGLRVVGCIALVFLSVFTAINSSQGILSLPRVMRPRIQFRRQVQMSIFAVIGLVLGAHSIMVTQYPELIDNTIIVYSSHASVLLTIFLLLISVFVHIVGWWSEQVIVQVPLNPDAEERAKNAIERGREIANVSKTYAATITLVLEALLDNTNVDKEEREHIDVALKNTVFLVNHVDTLHEEIKLLGPLVLEVVSSDTKKQD